MQSKAINSFLSDEEMNNLVNHLRANKIGVTQVFKPSIVIGNKEHLMISRVCACDKSENDVAEFFRDFTTELKKNFTTNILLYTVMKQFENPQYDYWVVRYADYSDERNRISTPA